jgi:hypothetical protein
MQLPPSRVSLRRRHDFSLTGVDNGPTPGTGENFKFLQTGNFVRL